MKYEIPDHVVKNLQVFLERTELKGNEVVAYVEIINILRNPMMEEAKETEG